MYPLYLLIGAFSQFTLNIIIDIYATYGASLVAQTVKNLTVMWEIQVRSLDWGRSPGDGNVNPLQYFCLENSMDRGDWQSIVPGASKNWTRLSN